MIRKLKTSIFLAYLQAKQWFTLPKLPHPLSHKCPIPYHRYVTLRVCANFTWWTEVPASVLVLPHLTHYFVTCCCTVDCQSSATLLRHGVPLRVVVTSNSVIPQFWLVNLSFARLTSTLCSLSVYSIMMASRSWIFSIHFWTTVNTKFVPSFYVLSYWNMQQIIRVCAVITRTCLPSYCTSVVNQLVKKSLLHICCHAFTYGFAHGQGYITRGF